MKVAGIDVSRGKITVCILEEIPHDLKRFKNTWKPLTFEANPKGIAQLIKLEFDGCVLEPTGGHYSKLWAYHLTEAERDVRWVGHREVASYRESWKVFNKSDKTDAIALACYGLERWSRPQFFIQPGQLIIRELHLQLEHLNRDKNPVINRLRQQLSHEFPEASTRTVSREWLAPNPPGLWRAIAGEPSEKWRREIEQSIGLGISSFSQGLAKQIILIEKQEYDVEVKLALELDKPEYQPYRNVFQRYDVGNRIAAALLSAVYPIDQFLENGRMITDHINTSKGKRSRYNRSMARFKLACGLGMVQYQSGDSQNWKPGGRSDVRKALWQWCKIAVVMRPNLELVIIRSLRDYYENGVDRVVDGKSKHFDPGIRNQRIQRVVRRMLERLFKDLIKEVV